MKKNNSETLKKRIEKYKIEIKELKQKIREMKENHLLFAFDATERAAFNYDMILNPHPQKIKAASGGLSEEYEIKATEVICILSEERTKKIYTIRKIKNVKDEFIKKQEIFVNSGFNSAIQNLDSLGLYLMLCSKSAVINVAYYDLNNDELVLRIKNYPFETCNRIPIVEPHIEEFKRKKKDLMQIISLHKKWFRDKV